MRATARRNSLRVGTFIAFRACPTATSTRSFPFIAACMALTKFGFFISSSETWLKTASPRARQRSKTLFSSLMGASLRAQLWPRAGAERCEVHLGREVLTELLGRHRAHFAPRAELDRLDGRRPDVLTAGDLVGIAHPAVFLDVAVVPAEHPKGVLGIGAPDGQAEDAHVVPHVVDRLAPLAVAAEDRPQLAEGASELGLLELLEHRGHDRQRHVAVEGGVRQAHVDPQLLARDADDVLRADPVVGGEVDARPDRLGYGQSGQDALDHAVDGHEVELGAGVAGKAAGHEADGTGAR